MSYSGGLLAAHKQAAGGDGFAAAQQQERSALSHSSLGDSLK